MSPPPSLRSLFDFGIAGPLTGLVISLAFLVHGLDLTASLDLSETAVQPALPAYLLRSSALGGELLETFLGRGRLAMLTSDSAVVSLHPFAIAGFAGMFANAIALLPLGSKSNEIIRHHSL